MIQSFAVPLGNNEKYRFFLKVIFKCFFFHEEKTAP